MNLTIKFRESFRPFAPVVMQEHAEHYFEMLPPQSSPYMLLTFPVRRDSLPATTHVDGSARVQTADRERNPLLHRLLECFYEKTGCPALINTSFNVRGEPIVCTPEDAYHCFMATDMDALALGRRILLKEQQKNPLSESERQTRLQQFPLD